MTGRKIASEQEIRDEFSNVTLYPSGKENIGKEPIKGETILEQDKSSKLEKGLRIAGGMAAFVAACSLLQDPIDAIEQGPTWLNTMIGTPGEFLTLVGGTLIASGKAGAELVKDFADVAFKKFEKDSENLKKDFVKGVANSRKDGLKIGKKFQSYTKEAIESLKGMADSTQEFEIYRPKRDGGEGVELDERIVTRTNKIKNTKEETTYKKDENGNLNISKMVWEKARGGK